MTSDTFYESFLNVTANKFELDKVKRIHSEILETLQKTERKPKRKSPKKDKVSDGSTTKEIVNTQATENIEDCQGNKTS